MVSAPRFLAPGAAPAEGDSGRNRATPPGARDDVATTLHAARFVAPSDDQDGPSDNVREVGLNPELDQPRGVLSEGSARSLLLTVLGELVLPDGEPVWTASLLYAFAGLGVSEQAARQTIARASTAGWLTSERYGREVRWAVTPEAAEIIEETTGRVLSLNTAPERWDGNCLVVIVTIPARRPVRKRLYSALSWAGFGNPAPGLWASPHLDRMAETAQVIEELGLRESTISFVGTTARIGLTDREIVERGWNLHDVGARYAKLLDTFADLKPAHGDDLLFAYLALVNEWHTFPTMDPRLPENLLPDWIGRRAVRTFVDLRGRWRPGAQERWRQVVKLTSP